MTSQLFKRLGGRIIGIATVAALTVGVSAATASAAVSVTPSSGLSATEATALSVGATELEASETYRIGLCSTATYGSFGIPACGESVEAMTNGSGAFSTSLEVEKTTFNVHSEIMLPFRLGQPETFTCSGNSEEDDECEVTVTYHDGTSSEVVGTAPISFE